MLMSSRRRSCQLLTDAHTGILQIAGQKLGDPSTSCGIGRSYARRARPGSP
jgi:hypothetical protein